MPSPGGAAACDSADAVTFFVGSILSMTGGAFQPWLAKARRGHRMGVNEEATTGIEPVWTALQAAA
jgi:hypothetical protein